MYRYKRWRIRLFFFFQKGSENIGNHKCSTKGYRKGVRKVLFPYTQVCSQVRQKDCVHRHDVSQCVMHLAFIHSPLVTAWTESRLFKLGCKFTYILGNRTTFVRKYHGQVQRRKKNLNLIHVAEVEKVAAPEYTMFSYGIVVRLRFNSDTDADADTDTDISE